MVRASKLQFDTTPTRAAAGLAVGSVTGGLCIAASLTLFLYPILRSGGFSGLAASVFIMFAYATMAWAIGLIVLAGPFWLIHHKRGLRSWRTAAILGATLAFIAAFGMGAAGQASSKTALWALPAFTLLGGVIGFVVWRTAYRPAAEPSADMPE